LSLLRGKLTVMAKRSRKTHECDTESSRRVVLNGSWTYIYSCSICKVEQYRFNDKVEGVVINPPAEEGEEG